MLNTMIEKFELHVHHDTKETNEEAAHLNIESLSIPCYRKEFYYSDTIQKETNIRGYKRIKIPWENLTGVFRHLLNDNSLEIQGRKDIKKIAQKLREHMPKYTKETADDYKARTGDQLSSFGYNEVDEVMQKIFSSFSNNEFPKKTINHVFEGYTAQWGAYEQFLNDKIFLQKILHFDSLRGRKMMEPPRNEIENLFVFVNKETGLIDQSIRLRDDEKYQSFSMRDMVICLPKDFSLLDKNLTAINTVGGLNVTSGKVWGHVDFGGDPQPIFGFDPNEQLLQEYFVEVLSRYEKLKKQSTDIAFDLVASSNFMLENNASNFRFDYQKFIQSTFPDEYKKIIRNHPFIPILLNSNVPDLRWGHAKYAVIPGENLNLIKLEHV